MTAIDDSNNFVVFTDGSCIGKADGRIAGIGVHMAVVGTDDWADVSRLLNEDERPCTNVRAEMAAVGEAVRMAMQAAGNQPFRLHIYTDSKLTIGHLDYNWKVNVNADLVYATRAIFSKARRNGSIITFEHVKGHGRRPVGDELAVFRWEGNKVADLLATAATNAERDRGSNGDQVVP